MAVQMLLPMMAAIVQTIEKEKDVNLERKNYLWSNR
jgi:hypothetical protein